MKRRITYGLLILLLFIGCYFTLRYAFGIFTPFNMWTAKQAIKDGKIQLVEIGEMPLNFKQKQQLANAYGFDYHLYGCKGTTDLINGTTYYNNKMIEHLESNYGLGWWKKFQIQIDSIDKRSIKKDS